MKKLLLPCLLILGISVFAQNKSFKINGTVTNDFKGYLYLKYGKKIDSTKVENKKFVFNGTVGYPTEAAIVIKNGVFGGTLYIENNEMNVEVIVQPPVTVLQSISGNESAKIQKELTTYFESIQGTPDFSEKLYKKLQETFKKNPKNQMFGELLSDVAMNPIFSKKQLMNLLAVLDKTTLGDGVLKSINSSIRKFSKYKVGDNMLAIELPNEKGKIVKLSDLKGKVVLVEFWASWCAPCRKNNEQLKPIYEKYHSLGFEILGVSLDKNKDYWLKALKKDNVKWLNTKMLEGGWNDKLAKELIIQYVPSNFLISKEGKILAVNIQTTEMSEKLNKLLK